MLRHRLPRLWRRVVAAQLEAWRARRIAQLVLGAPDDVCDHLDRELSGLAHRVGATTLAALLDEAMMRLHPEERELDQLNALDHRHVTLHARSINDTGVADMSIRGDWKGLHDFDQTDSAQALLHDEDAPAPRKEALLVLHVADDAITGGNPAGRCGTSPILIGQLRDWLGRTDTHLTVQPVIDLAEHVASTAYESRGRLRHQVDLLLPHCVFPWCTREARRCDHDHVVPHADGGATCDCNLAPLCRRHHRLRTHAGWRYTRLDETTFLWSDPHGQQFLVDTTGTCDVTPPDRPVNRGSGCTGAGP